MTMYVILTSKGGFIMTKAISIRIDTELLDYLQDKANKEHRTLSNMITSILLENTENCERCKFNTGHSEICDGCCKHLSSMFCEL